MRRAVNGGHRPLWDEDDVPAHYFLGEFDSPPSACVLTIAEPPNRSVFDPLATSFSVLAVTDIHGSLRMTFNVRTLAAAVQRGCSPP